jgi:hypothetical protein
MAAKPSLCAVDAEGLVVERERLRVVLPSLGALRTIAELDHTRTCQ